VLALEGLTWRLTRLILPLEDLVPGGLTPPASATGEDTDQDALSSVPGQS
jgi:hypothetical protein